MSKFIERETLFELGADNIRMREYIYSLLDLSQAEAILDIGCGNGYDLLRIGAMASTNMRLIGIDRSEKAIKEARKNVGADPRYSFLTTDVSPALPFEKGTFDIVLSINFLECIYSKEIFLKNVHRVLRPNGQVVFAHFDWDSQLINGKNKSLIRKMIQTYNDWKQPWMEECDAWMGRRLLPLFNNSGLFDGVLHTYTLMNTEYAPGNYGYERIKEMGLMVKHNIIEKLDYETFCGDITKSVKNGEYFFSITMFIYLGRKR